MENALMRRMCFSQQFSVVAVLAVLAVSAGEARADDYIFAPAPTVEVNRIYRVNRYTGEMGACQYAIKDGTVGVTLCYGAGEGASAQSAPGDFDLVGSRHERESGIFRVNHRTGEMSICYVLSEQVVCTPATR